MNKDIKNKLHQHKKKLHLATILIVIVVVTVVVLFIRWRITQDSGFTSVKVDDAAVEAPSDEIEANIEVLPGDLRAEVPEFFTGDVKLKGLFTITGGKQVALIELSSGTIPFEEEDSLANIKVTSIENGTVHLQIDEDEVLLDMVNNKYTIPEN
jgi:DNA-directed RNA polymerase subunit K/omega